MFYIDRAVKSESNKTPKTAVIWTAELLLQVEALVSVRGAGSLAAELPPVFGGIADMFNA